MKRMLGNDVYKVWAAGTQHEGWNYSRRTVFFEGGAIYSYGTHFMMACRQPSGFFVVNADRYGSTTSQHQGRVRGAIHNRPQILIPFSALNMALIPLPSIQVIETEPDREIPYTYKRRVCIGTGVSHLEHQHQIKVFNSTQHLMGASVFKVGDKYYLSGIDEGATDLWRGYFLVLLPRPVVSVADARDSLRPDVVPEGSLRQGEYFFVPIEGKLRSDNVRTKHQLIEGGHHRVTELASIDGNAIHARGTVRHILRQHKMLKLGTKWHRVYKNLAVDSYPASGRVD